MPSLITLPQFRFGGLIRGQGLTQVGARGGLLIQRRCDGERKNDSVYCNSTSFACQSISDSSGLVLQDGQGQPIVVPRLRVGNLRLGLLQLRLTELHDRAQS
jgi:hypothetical protein